MPHPTDRITHTTAFVTPVVKHWLEREIAQWELNPGRIDPTTHRTIVSYYLCINNLGNMARITEINLFCLVLFRLVAGTQSNIAAMNSIG